MLHPRQAIENRCASHLSVTAFHEVWSLLAYSAVKVPAILIMLHGLIAPPGIYVFVRYSVVMQKMIVFVRIAFIAVRMRYAVIMQKVVQSTSFMMIVLIIVSVR